MMLCTSQSVILWQKLFSTRCVPRNQDFAFGEYEAFLIYTYIEIEREREPGYIVGVMEVIFIYAYRYV